MFVIPLVLMVAFCCDDAQKPIVQPPQRLSIEAAGAEVANYIRKAKPGARIDKAFAVADLTTDAVWDQLHAQVVKVKAGQVEQNETFVLNGDRVEQIGRAFGGDGVGSIVVADLAGDRKPLLIYSFAWGSGDHRSEIGILDLHGTQPKELRLTPIDLSKDDFTLRRADGQRVEVLIGRTVIGLVTAARKGNALQAAIQLERKLPNDIRQQLR
jgi:hypothetical protein